MGLIELGEVNPSDSGDEPAAETRPLPRPKRTRIIAAVLAALCATGLTGAGRPAPPLLAESWSMQIGPDHYPYPFREVLLISQGTPSGDTITAYDMATGKVRWTSGRGTTARWMSHDPESNQLYVAGQTRTVELPSSSILFGTDTTALDGDTGKMLWKHSGDQLAATAEQVLLGDRDELGRVNRLSLVRARDGAPIWDRSIGTAMNVVVSDGPADSAQIIYGTDTGTLTTLRYSDGVPIATRHVTPPEAWPDWNPQVLGGRFYDIRRGMRGTTVTTYRTDTLTELWRYNTSKDVYLHDCGPVICASDAVDSVGIDPATGAALWELLGTDFAPIGDGRLLVSHQNTPEGQSVIDASTARVIGAAPGDSTILALDDGDLLALRGTKTAPYRVAVSRWDPATGRMTLLGAVAGQADRCQVSGRRLICQGSDRAGVTDVG
ncbi:PQQ-binding-like beta-propeller repeat protein [Actinoplanes regularis]|uniref:outer membrane protein assembly factor BamB family protein n=1 Tax=Actinoplanes regularis TaxID=52697 RepID=UPI0024A4BEC5|nr:PQQ-binding-like beta-propeller repeat protein [Actinoplanes regularis]GLW29834.1 hypothetical protein Areg01_27740 [Actinoplanes regularis]